MKKEMESFCPVTHTMSIIGGKWKIVVISQLVNRGILRFKELERIIPGITPKMLIKVLKELEAEQLVTRRIYAEVPPRVEYSVTALGESLNRLITEIHQWGEYHQTTLSDRQVLAIGQNEETASGNAEI